MTFAARHALSEQCPCNIRNGAARQHLGPHVGCTAAPNDILELLIKRYAIGTSGRRAPRKRLAGSLQGGRQVAHEDMLKHVAGDRIH